MSGIMNMFVATKTTIATAVDAFFNRVTLLLNTSSTNGAQNNTFLDSSTNNFTITRNGNTTQGTFTPFSQTGWGNYFDGTDDRLTTSSALLAYSTGNASTQTATIEAMVYLNAYNASKAGADENAAIVAKGSTYMNFGINHLGNLILYHYDGSVRTPTSSGTVPLNTWTHVAVTLSGGVATFYINGSSSGTGTWYGLAATSDPVYIGEATGASASAINGYLSNLRISTTARTISVPTAPYTSDASTALLTCQSNRFVDISSNGYAITVDSGTPSVQAFSPFAPTAAYDAAVVGGSGYFDGTGDYLSLAATSAFAWGTGDITIECWLYLISTGSDNGVWDFRTGDSGQLFLVSNSLTSLQLYVGGASAYSFSINPNAWNHIAVVRNSGTLKTYLNGVQVGSVANTTNFTATAGCNICSFFNGTQVIGAYISNFRAVKGTAVYTAAFTPPTAPLTAITNTSLLTNFTNAGIFDSAAKNDLETVGNAQVSTTQAKWGTTSMAFDGTGDWLFLNSSAPSPIALGGGDFTVEMWLYPNSSYTSAFAGLMDSRSTADGAGLVYFGYTGTANQIGWKDNTTNVVTGTVTQSAWNHVAVVRDSGTLKLYINGSLASSGANSTNYTVPFKYIGSSFDPLAFNGYMDDLRITRGYARYSGSTYTQPSAAFAIQ